MRTSSVLPRFLLLTFVSLVFERMAPAAVPASERSALLALYESTAGASWSSRTGWGGAAGTECSWAGVECDAAGSTVVGVLLSGNNLVGTPAISGLPGLVRLDLSGNSLSGPFPAGVTALTLLAELDLARSGFSGSIPKEIGRLARLRALRLSGNAFSGEIPPEIGSLTDLEELLLDSNQLTGAIPSSFGSLGKLRVLYLGYNQLSGAIPKELWKATSLVELYLLDNQLTGSIPDGIGSLASLVAFDASDNGLTGEIPVAVGDLRSLVSLRIRSCLLTGAVPESLARLTLLEELVLSNNQLSGPVPAGLTGLSRLRVLELSENGLSGELPAGLAQLTALELLGLAGNALTGRLPDGVGNLASLRALDLERNQIGGEIPSALGGLPALETLYLGNNQLSGSVPARLGDLVRLRQLRLAGNLLSGTLPTQLGSLATLQVLDLSANQLTGSIPDSFGSLGALEALDLGYNQLSGSIPASLGSLGLLQYLILEENQLTGSIPSSLGALAAVVRLQLAGNRLSGAIPAELGGLSAVTALDLGGNQLSGELPGSLTKLVTLSDGYGLDLRWNALRTADAALRDFVNLKGPDFDQTQTVAPSLVSVAAVSTTQAALRWSPILYQEDEGGYQVLVAPVGSTSYEVGATLPDKEGDSATVSGLTAGRAYAFAVRAYTKPHSRNDSLLVSPASEVVTATTAAAGSVVVTLTPARVRVLPGGSAPVVAVLSPAQPVPVTVALAVSNSSFATVPASVTFAAGSGSATFDVTGVRVGTTYATATLPATLGGAATILEIVVDTSTCERPDVPTFLNAPQATLRAGSPVSLAWTHTLASDPAGEYQVDVTMNADCTTGRRRLVTPDPSISFATGDAQGTMCAVVRAVSGLGCASGDASPVRVTIQPSPAAFVVAQEQRPLAVTSVGVPATRGTLVFRNIGSQAGSLRLSSRIGTFTPKPDRFDSVAPGGLAVVALEYDPLASLTSAVLFDALCGSYGDSEKPSTVCGAVTLTTLTSPVTSTGGARLEVASTNEVHFIAPSGQAPPTQTITVANRGTAPVRLAPMIGPGGAWLGVAQADFVTPLAPGQSRSFVLSVDRTHRAISDGAAPVVTRLALVGVDGPAESRTFAVFSVFDEEPGPVTSGTSRPFLGERESSLFLATGVSAPGRGTYFLSDGWIRNKGTVPAALQLYYTPNGGDGVGHPGVLRANVTLPPYQTYRLADFVRGLFSTSGSGSVEIRSAQIANLSVRTTVDSLTVKAGGLARFGAEIPTIRSREGTSLGKDGGAPLLLPGIRGGGASAFRTNLILAETSGRALTVGLKLLAPDGTVLGQTTQSVLAYSKVQVNGTDDALFPQDTAYEGATLEVSPLDGIGSVAAFATVIDNASQAFTTRTGRSVLAASAAARGGAVAANAAGPPTRLVIPAVARAAGRNDSFFTTSVSMTNGTASDAQVILRYRPDGGTPLDATVRIPARKSVTYRDVLLDAFQLEPPTAGQLTLEGGDIQKLVVASETSTPLDLAQQAKGTSPATLAAYSPDAVQALGDPALGLPSALVSHPGLEESTRFRTNLILTETSGAPVTVRVRVFTQASGGVPLGEKTYDLGPYERLQVNRFVLEVTGAPEGASEHVDIDTSVEWLGGSGRVLAVATRIDNDPESKRSDIYVLGPLGPSQGAIGVGR